MPDDPSPPSSRRRAVLLVGAVLLLAAIVGGYYALRRPAVAPEKAEAPARVVPPPPPDEIELPDPELVRIRRTAERQPMLLWTFDAEAVRDVRNFQIEVVDADGYGTPVSEPLPPTARAWTDPRPLQDGDETIYSVVALGPGESRSYSVETKFVFRHDPAPPAPSNVRTAFPVVEGRAYASVSWDAPPASDAITRGYHLFSSAWPAHRAQAVPRRDGASPFLFEVTPDTPRAFTLEIVALGANQQESAPARVAVEVPFTFPAAPADVRAQRDEEPGTPLRIAWNYPETSRPTVKGFRIYEGGLLVADEARLPAGAREWRDPTLIADRTYRYEVAAVSSENLLSPRGAAAELTVPASHVRTPVEPPTGFLATWVEDGDALALQLEWSPPRHPSVELRGYAVEAAAGADPADAAFRGIGREPPAAETKLVFRPPQVDSAYSFRLYTVAADGRRSAPVAGFAPAPDALLPPARLIDFRVVGDSDDHRIEWVWRYPENPVLRGFRIYHNGTLVADEAQLDAAARSWPSGPLRRGVIHRFEIEAVGKSGRPAPRAPAREYEVF